MKVIGIVGYKKSGKTTLGLGLTRALNEMGWRVSVVKHVSGDIDLQDADSSKYSVLAEGVATVSSERTEIIQKGGRILEDVMAYLHGDIVLVEGFKKEKTYPKIVCLREEQEREALFDGLEICTAGFDRSVAQYDIADVDHVREIARLAVEKAFKLPNLDCEKCGYKSCYDLARAIVQGTETTDACLSLQPTVSISIDGRKMPLNGFTNTLFRDILLAMVSSLKGYRKGGIKIEMP
ncbi:MAG: molybdopterin-guanine dinucleotide biosynthesis protein MobB [Deltaproteobacteria bacterium]|nr:molybdopterin-guanine dinucleotide biosynthesis protein MobB [Deltaproteobacteria bacterium]